MYIRSAKPIIHWLSFLVIVLVTLTSVSACAQGGSAQDTVNVGVSLSLKGDSSDSGNGLKKGYELWAENVNKRGGLLGKQVHIDELEDGGNPTQVKTNINTLINQHHDQLILGEVLTPLAAAGAEASDRYGYAYVSPTGQARTIIDLHLNNVYTVSLPISSYLTGFNNYILSLPAQQRPQTIGFTGEDDPFVQEQFVTVKKQFEGKLRTVLDAKPYPAETTDYTPIAEQVVQSNADVVVLGTLSTQDSSAILKYFQQQHYNPKAIIATSGPDQGDAFLKIIGGAKAAEAIFVPNSGWYPQIKTYQNDEFVKSYIAKYHGTGDDISSDSVQGYAAAQVLEQAVNKAHSLDNKKLKEVLAKDSFNSIQGPVKFDDDGDNMIAVPFLYQWQNGHLLAVFPENEALANPEYPKPAWP